MSNTGLISLLPLGHNQLWEIKRKMREKNADATVAASRDSVRE